MPVGFFLFSLLVPLNMVGPGNGEEWGSFIGSMLVVMVIVNIPTFVFLAIYFACRGKQKRKKQMEKMNIQDLD